MVKNLKRDSVMVSFVFFPFFIFFIFLLDDLFQAVQGIFEAGSWLLETERLLNESLIENDRCANLKKRPWPEFKRLRANTKVLRQGYTKLNAKWWRFQQSSNKSMIVPANFGQKLTNLGPSWLKLGQGHKTPRMQLKPITTRALKRQLNP